MLLLLIGSFLKKIGHIFSPTSGHTAREGDSMRVPEREIVTVNGVRQQEECRKLLFKRTICQVLNLFGMLILFQE